jgi:hypothetical protein
MQKLSALAHSLVELIDRGDLDLARSYAGHLLERIDALRGTSEAPDFTAPIPEEFS